MSDIEIDEIELSDVETDEMDGSFLATAAVIGVGALLGFFAAKGYDMAKDKIQNQLAVRRARKVVAEDGNVEELANKAE